MYQQCIELIKKGMPQKAVEMVMASSDNDSIRYNKWTQIRRLLYLDESNRNPNYYDNMALLCEYPEITKEIQEQLEDIMDDTLQNQNRIHGYKKQIISDQRIDVIFKDIRPLFDFYYDFNLQADVKFQRKRQQHQQRVNKVDSTTVMATTDAQEIVDTAISIMNMRYYDSLQEIWRLVSALLIVSGRRNVDILYLAEFEAGPTEYQARVKNLSKLEAQDWVCIPLLCKYNLFKSRLDTIRQALQDSPFHDHGDVTKLSNEYGYITRHMHAIAGKRFNHTLRRNIYIELAWSKRHEQSRFLVGDHAVAKHRWAQYALCHCSHFISDTMLYQTVELTDGII